MRMIWMGNRSGAGNGQLYESGTIGGRHAGAVAPQRLRSSLSGVGAPLKGDLKRRHRARPRHDCKLGPGSSRLLIQW